MAIPSNPWNLPETLINSSLEMILQRDFRVLFEKNSKFSKICPI
jgi:hypothetical protein